MFSQAFPRKFSKYSPTKAANIKKFAADFPQSTTIYVIEKFMSSLWNHIFSVIVDIKNSALFALIALVASYQWPTAIASDEIYNPKIVFSW